MAKQLLDYETAQRVLGASLAEGADFAEVFAEDSMSSVASLDDAKIDELSAGHSKGVGIRVIYGETTGFAYTSEFDERSLIEAAKAARAVAKSSSGAKTIELEAARGGFQGERVRIDKARQVELLRRMDDTARSLGKEITQVVAVVGQSSRRMTVANSNGLFVADEQIRSRLMVNAIAKGDTGLQSGYDTIALTIPLEELLEEIDIDTIAKNAARLALSKLDAKPAPSGALPVVIKGGSGGILFHEACGHGLEADHIQKGVSVYANRIGEKVASDLVTLVDDATVGKEWGSFQYDDEGHPAKRNVLIEDGVLVDYMWDRNRSAKSDHPQSGNGRRQSYKHLPMVRMTNTYMLAGQEDPENIISSTPKGVYVAKLSGGQVNTATGDFVFGTSEAYLIENGKITTPLRDTNLIGNGPEILSLIDAVGNDFSMTPGTCGKDGQSVSVGCGQATLRVSQMTIGGTADA